jgi:CDGSH-type Zn-finger protein
MSDAKAFINPKSGSIRITGVVDETIENPKFCGCGQSKEKPLCDGSHKGILKD